VRQQARRKLESAQTKLNEFEGLVPTMRPEILRGRLLYLERNLPLFDKDLFKNTFDRVREDITAIKEGLETLSKQAESKPEQQQPEEAAIPAPTERVRPQAGTDTQKALRALSLLQEVESYLAAAFPLYGSPFGSVVQSAVIKTEKAIDNLKQIEDLYPSEKVRQYRQVLTFIRTRKEFTEPDLVQKYHADLTTFIEAQKDRTNPVSGAQERETVREIICQLTPLIDLSLNELKTSGTPKKSRYVRKAINLMEKAQDYLRQIWEREDPEEPERLESIQAAPRAESPRQGLRQKRKF
jgi:hypothetical protein